MPRFAANISMMFTEWDFLDRFAAAADAGFELVEFQFAYDHAPAAVAARAQAAGVSTVLINAPAGDMPAGERGLAVGPAARFAKGIEQAAAMVEAVGARFVHVMAGNGGERAQVAANLAHAVERLGRAGATALTEPLNPHEFPGYHVGSFDTAVALMAAVPGLRLLYDLYHRQRMEGEVINGLRTHFDAIGHIQIAGAPDRHEPDAGELDHVRVLEALDAIGYTGVVGCEYRPAAGTREGLGWLARWRG